MAVMLEMIGSFVLAMMITITVLRMQFIAEFADSQAKATYLLQIYAENVRRDLKSAFTKAGYNIEDKANAVVTCTGTAFSYKTDMNGDGQIETNYINVTSLPTGTTPKLSGDQRIRFTFNGRTRIISCPGLVGFSMTYYTKAMALTTTANQVAVVHFKYTVSSTQPISYKRVGANKHKVPVYAYAWVEENVYLRNLFIKY
jgi:hypothetical protein